MPLSSSFIQTTPSTRKVSMFGTQAPSSRTPCTLVSEFFMREELQRTLQPGASDASSISDATRGPCSLHSRLQRGSHHGAKHICSLSAIRSREEKLDVGIWQQFLPCRTSKDQLKTPQEMEHQIGRYNQYEELCCLQVKEEELIGFRISQMHFVLRLASKILLYDCFIIKIKS